jgi:hypothetical protein
MPETCTTINCCLPNPAANPIEPDTGDFTVDASVSPEDSGEVTGDGEHERSSTVTLTATPELGYEFVAWEDSNGFVLSEESEWTFTITQNMSVVAVFEAA